MDLGEAFLSELITGQQEQHGTGGNEDDGHNDPVDNDASLFSVTSVDEVLARDIFGNLDDGPDDVSGSTAANQLAENEVEIENLPILFDRFAPLPQNPTTEQINAAPSIPPPPIPQTNNGIAEDANGPRQEYGASSYPGQEVGDGAGTCPTVQ